MVGQKYSLTLVPQRQMAMGTVQLRPKDGSTNLKAKAVCTFPNGVPKPRLELDLTWSV
jgi:hypothetical protein